VSARSTIAACGALAPTAERGRLPRTGCPRNHGDCIPILAAEAARPSASAVVVVVVIELTITAQILPYLAVSLSDHDHDHDNDDREERAIRKVA
jgi:hypothetical protein